MRFEKNNWKVRTPIELEQLPAFLQDNAPDAIEELNRRYPYPFLSEFSDAKDGEGKTEIVKTLESFDKQSQMSRIHVLAWLNGAIDMLFNDESLGVAIYYMNGSTKKILDDLSKREYEQMNEEEKEEFESVYNAMFIIELDELPKFIKKHASRLPSQIKEYVGGGNYKKILPTFQVQSHQEQVNFLKWIVEGIDKLQKQKGANFLKDEISLTTIMILKETLKVQ